MSEWFNINGTAMIYIRDSKSIRGSKTTKEANHRFVDDIFDGIPVNGFVVSFHLKSLSVCNNAIVESSLFYHSLRRVSHKKSEDRLFIFPSILDTCPSLLGGI